MKRILFFLLVCLINMAVFSQTSGDFRSKSNGDWASTSTWETYDGSLWINAITIPSSSSGLITILNGHTVTISDTRTIDQTIVEEGAALTLTGDLTLNDVGGTDLQVNGTFNVATAGRFEGSGQVIIDGTMNWSKGEITVSSITISANRTLSISGSDNKSFRYSSGTIHNYGTINWTGTGNIRGGSNYFVNYADSYFNIQNEANIEYDGGGGGYIHFENYGTLVKSSSSGTSNLVQTIFTNGGIVQIQSGTLSIGAGSSSKPNTGTFNTANGCTLSFNHPGGTAYFGDGAQFTNSGIVEMINSSGALQFLGTVAGSTIAEVTTFNYSAGILTGAGKLLVNGIMNWSSGQEYNLINTTISSTGVMNIIGESNRIFRYSSGKIYNNGTINWTGSGAIRGASNGFQNNSGGTFNILVNAAMNYDGGGGSAFSFLNDGTLNLGNYVLSGSVNFTHSANANLIIGSADGITSSGSSGNIQVSGTRSFSTSGNYSYTGSSEQNTGNGLPATINNLTINNGSGVILTNGVTVNGDLTLTNGDLSLNGKVITLGSSAVLSESAGSNIKGTTGKITATRTINATDLSGGVNIAGLGAKITTDAALGSTIIERTHNQANGNSHSSINRIFKITPTNNSGLNATLDFFYDESEIGSISENNLRLFKSSDSTDNSWTLIGGNVDTENNKVTLINIDGFSYWTLGDVNSPLPVELTSFTAALERNTVSLTWQTTTEVNNYGFDVERSQKSKGIDQNIVWEMIGFVEGNGNSNAPKEYAFVDESVSAGKYDYRLKQIDTDGKFSYSDKIEVEVKYIPKDFMLYQNYPNPFNPSTIISWQLPVRNHVTLKVHDILGNEVATLLDDIKEAGYYEIEFSPKNLSTGVYFYRLISSDFTQTKKLIFIK